MAGAASGSPYGSYCGRFGWAREGERVDAAGEASGIPLVRKERRAGEARGDIDLRHGKALRTGCEVAAPLRNSTYFGLSGSAYRKCDEGQTVGSLDRKSVV